MQSLKRTVLLIAAILAGFTSAPAFAATYYVPDDFATIQAALNGAVAGDEVIVRDGVYTGAGNRDLNFLDKAITLRSQNGPGACIIDAEGSATGVHRGFHLHSGERSGTVIEGFTITGGYQNQGGAIRCHNGSPTIANCIISGNTATDGGGIYCYVSSPIVKNCVISGNTGVGSGGGIYCFNTCSPQLIHCAISGNASQSGGAIRCITTTPTIIDSILWGDSAVDGPEIYISNSSNLTVSYSDVQGGQAAVYVVGSGTTLTWGAGNIDAPPLFVGGGDFHLAFAQEDMGVRSTLLTGPSSG